MIEIKRLTIEYHEEFRLLNRKVREALNDTSWFMPLSEKNIDNMFDPSSTLVVYGAIVDGTLAAVSLFDTCKEEYQPLAEAVNVPCCQKGAELGASMVLPQYRGQNLMLAINTQLISAAKEMGIEYFVATAHPDNLASNSSLKKLGMSYITTITRHGGYIRNVYYMDIAK